MEGIRAGFESHNALVELKENMRKSEKYLSILVFNQVEIRIKVILALALNSCNASARPSGRVPPRLSFGVIPQTSIHSEDLSRQHQQLCALYTACSHINQITAKPLPTTAAYRKSTSATYTDKRIGNKSFVNRDLKGK